VTGLKDCLEAGQPVSYNHAVNIILTFCGSIIPILIMTNLMMSNQGSWRMSRGHASTNCLTSSVYLYTGTHLSPSSCICNHPINPLNHTAIYPNPCLGEKCWWNIPNIGQSLTCTTRLMITPGRHALPDGKKNKKLLYILVQLYTS